MAAAGREARRQAPRSSHADWQPTTARPDPVKALIDQAEGRVAELLPLRYGRMLVSPFAFYRGGAAIMARDLVGTPTSGLSVQLCGDAHLSNFGTFSSPERELVLTSMTSTRRCQAPGNGMSSASRRASASPVATVGSRARTLPARCCRPSRPTVKR